MHSGLVVPEIVYLLAYSTIVHAFLDTVQNLIEALRIEEFFKFFIEYLKLMFEVMVVVTVTHAINQLFACLQVTRLSTPMQLVLKSVLYL